MGGDGTVSRRKKVVTIGIVSILALAAVWSLWLMPAPTISAEQIPQLTITALPSPPTTKTVTNRDEIGSFVAMLRSVPLHRSPHLGEMAGWQFKIETNTYLYGTIFITGNEVRIHGFWYATDADIVGKMEELYRKLPETPFQE